MLLLGAAACSSDRGPEAEPPPKVTRCAPEVAPDLDPADGVVQVELTAKELAWDPGTGTPVDGLGYNGGVPGPVIEVQRGDTLRVDFTNDTDMDTTIHWHGLRVPEEMDGVSQMEDPVRPGESFTYAFEVRDAGFYWYHPHMDTDEVLERGLYGVIVARERGETPAACEVPLALDDVLLDAGGQIQGAGMMDSMGRLGNVLLANGYQNTRVEVRAGQSVLLRMVNAANARYFRLSVPEHRWTVVGSDGGWLAEPYESDELVLAPGERALVRLETTGAPGESYPVQTRPVALHGPDAMMREDDPLGEGPATVFTIAYAEEGAVPDDWSPPPPDVPDLRAGEVLHRWVLAEEGMHRTTIDGEVWPDVPPVNAEQGTVTTLEIDNRSEMRHPFHLHGQRFQVLAIDEVEVEPPAWKDTVDVPAGSLVRIASELDNPGDWLYHCHILEHAEDGMAGLLLVAPADAP